MDIDFLFDAALVALGPPMRMPHDPRDKKNFATSEFNAQVGEYNYFVMQNFGIVMPEYSYEQYSRWFHSPRRR